MTDREPVRMIDDDREAELLRVDLSRAAEHDVGYDVAAGVAAFEASLASAPAGTEVAGSGGATGGGLGTGKLLLILVGVAAVGGAVAVGVSNDEPAPVVATAEPEDPRPAIVPEPPETAPEPETSAEPAVVPVPNPGPLSEPDPDLHPDPDPAPTPAPETPKPKKAKPEPKPDPEPSPAIAGHQAEMEATNRARKALASDPARALELAREADEEFADGLFREQRDGIKALALLAMGKAEAGRKAAQAYLRKHPKGTYADKVRSKLEEKP